MNANNQNHRAILQSIAHRVMLERGLLPDFSTEALSEARSFKSIGGDMIDIHIPASLEYNTADASLLAKAIKNMHSFKEITSNMEKHVRSMGGTASEDGSTEDVRDRQFGNHLKSCYDGVVAWIRDVETIQIFGPGEAKGELEKRLKDKGFRGHILAIETVDKMTDRQISAKVREHFQT